MTHATRPAAGSWTRALPNEHGFWVMLSAAVLSAELRVELAPPALVLGVVVSGAAVACATLLHRKLRSQQGAQLVATACLGLAGAPIEWAGGLPLRALLAGSVARIAIFVASSLLVRSAFARSARKPGLSSTAWQAAALLLLAAAGTALALAGWLVEALACAMAGAVYLGLAAWKPTAKQLKPLGLGLAGVALGSALVLAL